MDREIQIMFFNEISSVPFDKVCNTDLEDEVFYEVNKNMHRAKEFSGKVCRRFLEEMTRVVLPDMSD